MNPRKARPRWLRLGLWALSVLSFWCLAGTVVLTVMYLLFADEIPALPEFEAYTPPLTTRVHSRSGLLVGEFASQRREVVRVHKVPRRLVQAFLAAEDERFFSHGGIDPWGVLRAFIKNAIPGGSLQGGSTITQQVAKSFVGSDRTLVRKYKEGVLALRMEEKYTKEQILHLYLHEINLGNGSHGVQAASLNHFHKNVWDLSLPEMALLAALPQGPERRNPVTRPDRAKARRDWVLSRMHEEGFISESEMRKAQAAPLLAHRLVNPFKKVAPWFTEEVRRTLQERYGAAGLNEGGLVVETTLDVDWQHAAQRAMARGLEKVDRRQGYRGAHEHLDEEQRKEFLARLAAAEPAEVFPALVTAVDKQVVKVDTGHERGVLKLDKMRWARKPDPTVYVSSPSAAVKDARRVLRPGDVIMVRNVSSGEKQPPAFELVQPTGVQGALLSFEPALGYVRALIGGSDFSASEFNRATQACRQPGSTFKPLYYSLAIDKHDFSPATQLLDSPVVYDDPETGRYKPRNPSRDFKGFVTVHTALVNSMAVPSIKVLESVGVAPAIEWAMRLGITTELRPEVGLALGSSCVTPWDLSRAYAVFMLRGEKPDFHFIRKVTDRHGRVLLNHTSHLDPFQPWDEKFDRAYDRLASPPERVMSPQSSFLVTHLLKGVATRGTGARASRLKKPVAGKTGTTNDSADTWFLGFTRDVLTCVWVGNDSPANPLSRGEDGGRTALPIWLAYMQDALAGRPQGEFTPPDGITFARMDPLTGELASPGSPGSVLEAFKSGDTPRDPATDPDPADTRSLLDPGMF
jgi:penicillin-binding protein 1A